ncbi:MAG: hypothetical protein AVO35_09205 [Candidatus Aegiribacteria sp. MLS_C]|nr:MAG: hypothetical protein AVO35_09205 [Candidatus Aegiribacteria sp. MLS_C]
MKNGGMLCIAFAVVMALAAGCMGTFETARVAGFRAGVTYFGTGENDEEKAWSMPGVFLEGGFPAGPSRFGLGLHIKAMASVGEDDGFLAVWGGKLQIPENFPGDAGLEELLELVSEWHPPVSLQPGYPYPGAPLQVCRQR